MQNEKPLIRIAWMGCFLVSNLLTSPTALARGERVMGAANEGALLRSSYIQKMEKIDQDKKQCRSDIEKIIQPQLVLLDEFGQRGLHGPSRLLKHEADLQKDARQLEILQGELSRLGKTLAQAGGKNDPTTQRQVRLFEQRLTEYTLIQKNLDEQSNSLVGKSEQLATNFVPFAKAVLKIKKLEACEDIWNDLRPSLPKNLEQTVARTRTRVKQMVASVKADSQTIASAAARLLVRLKTKSQVAVDDESL